MASGIGTKNLRPFTYFLVEFFEEVEQPLYVVPSNWLVNNENDECYWPNFIKSDSQRFRAAKDRREPNPDTWLVCRIRIKYRSYSMESAIAMMKRLEEGNLSLTNDETDTGVKKSRLRAKKRKISYEWRNGDEENRAYGNKKSRGYNSTNESMLTPTTSSQPIIRLKPIGPPSRSTPSPKSPTVTGQTILSPVISQKLIPGRSTPSPKPPTVTGHTILSPVISVNRITGSSTLVSKPPQRDRQTDHQALPCNNCISNTVSNERLFTLLEELTNQVRGNTTILNKIWGIMHLPGNAGGRLQPGSVSRLHEPITGLPCSSIQELTGLNEMLTNCEEMSKRVISLGFYGGKDETTTVWNVLTHVMTTPLADLLRWAGRHGKISIQKFPRVLDMITLAVKQTFPNSQSTGINNIIKPWLRGSRDRDGRRAKRQVPLQSNPAEESNAEDANPEDSNAEDANPEDSSAEDANPEYVINTSTQNVEYIPESDATNDELDLDILDFEDY